MRLTFLLTALVSLALTTPGAAAQVWGELTGRVTDAEAGETIPGASVLVTGTNFGSATDAHGRYAFRIPEGRYAIRVSAVGFEPVTDSVTIGRGQTVTFNAALETATFAPGEAVVEDRGEQGAGISTIDPATIRDMPTPVADALRSVKVQLGVTSNNELSNAYSVRGGSYAENQFFIDGFEVYRPLRARQGEQEGLGLVNGDLAEGLTLYAAGFPARYGGKLASVLNADYIDPEGDPTGTAYLSTLDAGAMVKTGLANDRVGVAVAARNARPRSFFGTQELKGDYDPNFFDVQGVATIRLAETHRIRAVGLRAGHRFRFAPTQRRTTFGIFPNLVRTVASEYDGTETDGYDVTFGGLRLTNRIGSLLAEHAASGFQTEEFERYDVTSLTQLFRRERNPDNPTEFDEIREGQAQQRDQADNRIRLTALTGQGRYRLFSGRAVHEVGWQARRLRFEDELLEFSRITGRDSMGTPVQVTVDSLSDAADLSAWQAAFWAEESIDALPERDRLVVTAGLRADYFDFNDEWTVSPRASALFRLNERTTLTAAGGIYYQAPTYRELRGEPAPGQSILGALNRDLESQRSVQGVLGVKHFLSASRITLRAEVYAKRLSNLISYSIENVRVVYSGENDSEGTAYGIDLQARGELIPGLESWVNYGFLVTDERFIEPEGYSNPQTPQQRADSLAYVFAGAGDAVPRPTDRRHNLTVFVQDHIPGDDSWTVHVRALFGSGTPTTPPSVDSRVNGVAVFQPGRRNSVRYPSYRRFDMGVTKRIRIGSLGDDRPVNLMATAEVLNVFDMTNVISYTWTSDGDEREFFQAVPTRLTPQTINVRLRVDF